jgi:predicted ATPase
MTEVFAANAGLVVDTQGDSFFAVFTRAGDAAAAAVDAQRVLEGYDWPAGERVRVRIGLHSGEAVVRDSHYIGQEVHRASRICDAGHGGQIVMSQTTAQLVRDSLLDGAIVTTLGDYRLKDLGQPQRLFLLGIAGLQALFPCPHSLDIPTNMPAERSSFIGRDAEIGTVRGKLAEHRLVTLTGIGGSGKTRLALRVGALELGDFPDGVFFIDLTPLSDASLLAPTVAGACGLMLGDALGAGVAPFEDRLIAVLARRKSLLLVDNCEHMIEAVAALLDRILTDCGNIMLLATSREALAVEGEQVVPVTSLAVPDDAALTQAQAATNDAVRLFVERAKGVRPAFLLGHDNWRSVAEICRGLDGIPLAIEFAAARVAHLSVQQIAERLQDRFRLLTGGRRRIQRQQTMAATLDWSHDLLSDNERIAFRRFAVFAGSFALDAAEAICSGEDITQRAVVDLMSSLVAKSLVTTVADDRGQTRYRLLETVRIYASEKLAEAGEAQKLHTLHRDWYLGWLQAMPPERWNMTIAALVEVAREFDGLRAAANWCLANDQPDLLARLASRLISFWGTGSLGQEGRSWLLSALQRGERVPADERVACHAAVSTIFLANGEILAGLEHASRAIDLSGGQASLFLVAALGQRAFVLSLLSLLPGSDPELVVQARGDLAKAQAMARSGHSSSWVATSHLFSAFVDTNLGDLSAATVCWRELVVVADYPEEPNWFLPMGLAGLSVSLHLAGKTEEALHAARRMLGLLSLSDTALSLVRYTALEITPALVAGGQHDAANQLLRDAARDVRRIGIPKADKQLLIMVGITEHLRGRSDRAARLLAAARQTKDNPHSENWDIRSVTSATLYIRYLALVRGALGQDEARRARDEGHALTMDEALAYAMEGLG